MSRCECELESPPREGARGSRAMEHMLISARRALFTAHATAVGNSEEGHGR